MQVTNEQSEETPRLTVGDLGVAAWACSELFNYMLEGYEQEEYGEMTKEQTEQALNKLRMSFVKFDALASALSPEPVTDEQVDEIVESGDLSDENVEKLTEWVEDQIEPHELTDSEEEWPEQESEPEDEEWSE
jgi:hypothetical protein